MSRPLGVCEYADRRGVAHSAVSKAIASGRLRRSVTRLGRRVWIDVDLADAEWERNTLDTGARYAPLALGLRAYARRRGVTHAAVQKAIVSHRLRRSVTRRGRRVWIDPDLADEEWERNTLATMRRSSS